MKQKRWVTLAGSIITMVGAYLRLRGMGEFGEAVAIFGGCVIALGLGRKSDRVKTMLEETKAAIKESNKEAKKEEKNEKEVFDPMQEVRDF